ncbi:ketose-bisphosphate aldolase [Treponema vincentii]|uniref:ketose-bisphosphate aldolase n=1 Tax=Treponema TaxID=157 RepID=UPI001BAF5490|nr:ketose-bisphosphate aldolase [Treponema vincentii]QUY17132.1 ketose-bisphosphate aldolase [Treponema vincentii]
MALALMTDLLREAEQHNKAVGAFNVADMEMIIGAIKAAETANTPIILQIAQARLVYSPFHLIAPMMVSAARAAKVAVAVHLDHGQTLDVIHSALDYGFTSVMIDGSALPLEQNIAITNDTLAAAKKYGAGVEAELGTIGGSEGGAEKKAITTNPETVKEFLRQAPADALAVAIGNAHGHYKGTPQLDFEVLKTIHALTPAPLVLHGGTGISDEDFRRCIDCGIRKINIATANFDAFADGIRAYCARHDTPGFFGLHEAAVQGVYKNVLRHIAVFNNEEKS